MHMAAALDMEKICAPLVRILQRGDSFSKSQAVRALCDITMTSDGQAAAVAAGAIPPLVMLLRSDEDSVERVATAVLQHLTCASKEVRDSIAAAGAVPALIEIVNSGSERSKEHAAHALANLAWNHYGSTVSIVPFVQLLRDGSDDAKEAAALGLRNLCGGSTESAQHQLQSDNRVAIAAAGAIPLLVAVETGSHAGAKEQAAAALHNLGIGNADNQVAIAKARGAEALVRIARRGRIELRWKGRVVSYLPSAGASERVARLLAKRRDAIIRKILEAALPAEIATYVVAPFLGRWGGSWP